MKITIIALLAFLASSCSTPSSIKSKPVWTPEIKLVDGVVSPKLKKFLKSTASPKVVLRVPNVASTITQSDTTTNIDYNTFYGRFERQLVQEGFVLRDRALLQSLMSSGMSDYSSIGKKLDTDLIIEITNFKFDKDLQKANDFIDESNNKHYAKHPSTNQIFTLEARIIEIKTGEVGSILTIKTTLAELLDVQYMYFLGFDWLPRDINNFNIGHYTLDGVHKPANELFLMVADSLSKKLIQRLRGDI